MWNGKKGLNDDIFGVVNDDLATGGEEVVGGVPMAGREESELVVGGNGGGARGKGVDFLLAVVEVASLDEGVVECLGGAGKRERRY